MSYGSDTLHCALHGFSDASTTAFATMYLRIVNIDDSITISLLAMKSKVVSLKTISIPRLELSATLLLARLMHFARSALQLSNLKCHCWMDSTITFAWESVTFPMEKHLSPIAFRLCNHTCSMVVRSSMVTSSSRPGRTRVLRYLPMFLLNNAQKYLRYVLCTLHPNRISRRIILRGQNCYELSLICIVF